MGTSVPWFLVTRSMNTFNSTEESIWAGPPVPVMPDSALGAIEDARALIADGEYVKADTLILDKALPPRIAPRSQQPLGDLTIQFHGYSPDAI